jgi:DNA modification methylase
MQPARGRPQRFCSHPCRQVDYRRRTKGAKTRGLVTLVGGDARAFLAGLQSESVDLVVTDPPYEFAGGRRRAQWFEDLPDCAWAAILAEFYRVLRCDRHAYVVCDRRTVNADRKGERAPVENGSTLVRSYLAG